MEYLCLAAILIFSAIIYLFVWLDWRCLEFTEICPNFPKTMLRSGPFLLIRPDRHWIVESDISPRCETLFVDQPHSHRQASPHSPIYALEMHISPEWLWTGWGAPIHDDQGQIREGENLDQLSAVHRQHRRPVVCPGPRNVVLPFCHFVYFCLSLFFLFFFYDLNFQNIYH
jgi:hypothetical protein